MEWEEKEYMIQACHPSWQGGSDRAESTCMESGCLRVDLNTHSMNIYRASVICMNYI